MESDRMTSAWRQALGPNWAEQRALTDWMGARGMQDYVARVQSGSGSEAGGYWIRHSLDRQLAPLSKRLGRPLSMVSFGCGWGHVESALLSHGWPIGRIVCREFDSALLERAKIYVGPLCPDSAFEQFDFNHPELCGGEIFDVAFFCHSMHHCTDIERFLPYLNSIVHPNSIILGVDFFGPSRLQIDHTVKPLLDEIFSSLPDHLRLNLQTMETESEIKTATIAEIHRADPSEAPRSSDLRTLLFSTFPIVELSPMGGTLLRPLLANRAGNFQSEADLCILKLLMMLERELMASRRITSDNLYFVLGKSDRL